MRFWDVYGATLAGFTCTFLLGRAGEPIRPVLIARKSSLSMPGMFGVYVLERVFDMAATAVLAVLALLLFERKGVSGAGNDMLLRVARSAGVLLLLGLVGIIAFLIHFRYHGAEWLAEKLKRPKWRTGWREKVAALLEGFSDGLRGVRSWSDLGALAALLARGRPGAAQVMVDLLAHHIGLAAHHVGQRAGRGLRLGRHHGERRLHPG